MTAGHRREARTELTDGDPGVWRVTTVSGSIYTFDLNTRTVERVGGEPRRQAAPADVLQPLRGIIEVRVGRPGRWWMRNLSGSYADPAEVWQWSSTVVSIEAQCGDRSGAAVNNALNREPDTPVSKLSQNPTTPISESLSDLSALGPAFTARSMCDLLGIEPEQLDVMVADLVVLQVVTADGVPVFPSFQVGDDGRLLAGLGDVLGELAGGVEDPWTWWIWLASRPEQGGGRAMWELLRDGDVQAVVQAAGRAAWVWRQ